MIQYGRAQTRLDGARAANLTLLARSMEESSCATLRSMVSIGVTLNYSNRGEIRGLEALRRPDFEDCGKREP